LFTAVGDRKKVMRKSLFTNAISLRRHIVLLITFVVFSCLLTGYLYLSIRLKSTTQAVANQGDVDYVVEKNPIIGEGVDMPAEIDGKSTLRRGKYIKLQDNKLTYRSSEGKELTVPVIEQQVLLECSRRELKRLSEYNFNYSYQIVAKAPNDIGDYIDKGDDILVIYDLGTMGKPEERINTIIVNAENCPD
jgi:hypothetical protein